MSDLSVLEWYLEQGVTDILEDAPVNRLALQSTPKSNTIPEIQKAAKPSTVSVIPEMPLGSGEAKKEALRVAQAAQNLQELEHAIRGFDGLSIKKTATNLVFSDGNPKAPIMIVGEAPGGDEDIQGKPFAGPNEQLLDKMLAAIGLDRIAEDPSKSVYISSILNWRPPGNRTPSPAEIEISLVFIERHIALVQPKLLFLMGGVAAKALLNTNDSITKLRGKWIDYVPVNEVGGVNIPCLASFHPSFLVKTPTQKKLAWADMLSLAQKSADFSQQ